MENFEDFENMAERTIDEYNQNAITYDDAKNIIDNETALLLTHHAKDTPDGVLEVAFLTKAYLKVIAYNKNDIESYDTFKSQIMNDLTQIYQNRTPTERVENFLSDILEIQDYHADKEKFPFIQGTYSDIGLN